MQTHTKATAQTGSVNNSAPIAAFKARAVSLWPPLTYFKRGMASQNKVHASAEDTPPSLSPQLSRPSVGTKTIPPNVLFIGFDRQDEKVYQAYFRRQRLGVLPVLVAMSTLHAVVSVVVDLWPGYQEQHLDRVLVVSLALLLQLALFAVVSLLPLSSWISGTLGVLMWLILTVQILYDLGTVYPRHLPADMLGWWLVIVFVSQMTLPVGPWLGLPLVLILVGLYCLLVGLLWSRQKSRVSDFPNQMAANVLLCLSSAWMGLAGSLFLDRLNRRSVLEIKSALTAKNKIELAYKDKERLLLSVLPKHIADEMLKDVGSLADGQFRKIYMKRYENVSILFADIVGFTAISSTVTAAELVKILNELFASFDVLANKFHQVRIKILGDCYYCVCGALEPRSDHAVLTIHMGLSMVTAISTVRQSTGKDVNMRVGVHTGACLGGVLGQRQWQFDVLGKEVTLANKMESGGLPARVHVSQATVACLDGEFELEDGHGGDREEELKLHNVTTYLVKSVLKPYPEGTLDKTDSPSRTLLNGKASKTGHSLVPSALEEEEDSLDSECGTEVRTEFSNRLQQKLVEKDQDKTLKEQFKFFTHEFMDPDLERSYQQRSDSYSGLPNLALCVALLFIFLAKLCVLSREPLSIALFIIGEMILVMMAVVSMTLTFAEVFPVSLVRLAGTVDKHRGLRLLWAVSACLVFFVCDTAPVVECHHEDLNASLPQTQLDTTSRACHYIVYSPHSACLVLVAVSSMITISHLVKGLVILAVTVIHCLIILFLVQRHYDNYDQVLYRGEDTHYTETKYQLLGEILSIAVALNFYNSQMEFTARKLYLWKEESKKEKEAAAHSKLKNEALVYNLLPTHVARIFLGRKKTDAELYSHAYDEVGVLFAACPNFNSFYSEDSINNDGLECLRFLNEIISDYDELLNLPKFLGIVKIKTVGSTYMAASGMVTSGMVDSGRFQSGPNDRVEKQREILTIMEKWSHLNDLVQFALALQDVLTKINEQSFNNFILRIGINHGPIIAGVIGARKPHYDIWGNTVNVSSRMESTGQPGKIQVVKETKDILEIFGYKFHKRGLIKVKGKGELMTYFMYPASISSSEPEKNDLDEPSTDK